jgi:hypothetical protein
MSRPSPEQLLNTSWTIHRISPLHHSKDFQTLIGNPDALKTYARRLRDQLTGEFDYVQQQGVQVGGGLDDGGGSGAMSKAGTLKECIWGTIPTWSHYYHQRDEAPFSNPQDEDSSSLQQRDILSAENALGILVTLEYENITYKAVLLAGPDGYSYPHRVDQKGSTYLPVLLTRLPIPLRQSFISFLATTFDTYSSVLRLPSSFLCSRLEAYIASLTRASVNIDKSGQSSSEDGPPSALTTPSAITSRTLLEEVMKDVQLTLAFSPPVAPALKALDVHIPRESLVSFAVNGASRTQQLLRSSHPSPLSQKQEQASIPFLNSLSAYFERHLAMKLDLCHTPPGDQGSLVNPRQHVRLSKVACSAFVLGADGRIKIIADPGRSAAIDDNSSSTEDNNDEARRVLRANEDILRVLVLRAAGEDAGNE